MDAQERRCTGSTVCRGRMDAQERRCTGCTVCRGRMDAQERRCTGCTVCRGCRTTYRDVLVSREAGCWERLHRSGDVQGRTGRYLLLQYLHFHHPCGRSRERTTTGKWEVRLQEVIGRVESGTETESNVGNSCRGAHERCMYKIELCRERTTTGMWEIEQRREQRSRKTKPGSGDSRILYPG